MKKTITVMLIITILLNLISIKSFASDLDKVAGELEINEDIISDPENLLNRLDNQEANVTGNGVTKKQQIVVPDSMGAFIVNALVKVVTLFPQSANRFMQIFVATIGDEQIFNEITLKDSAKNVAITYIGGRIIPGSESIMLNNSILTLLKPFTIYDTVMGNYEVFNLSYHKVPEKKPTKGPAYELFKYYILQYYKLLRNISIALSLFVLIYIGIRMAISTVASEKAKYNKMLLNWVSSLILVVFMHYIVIGISWASESILTAVRDFTSDFSINANRGVSISNFEQTLYSDVLASYEKANGWSIIGSAILIWIITYYQIKFFMMYMKRILEIGFLVTISPLVTITYSIDKAGDGKAQAFKTWLTELIIKASIQVVHAIVYCIFIGSAGYIAQAHPILAALFFTTLSRSEKIVRRTLAVNDSAFEKVKVPFMGK